MTSSEFLSTAGKSGRPVILVLNPGSSSVKFAAYELNGDPQQLVRGALTGIGGSAARLAWTEHHGPGRIEDVGTLSDAEAHQLLLQRIGKMGIPFVGLAGIGIRVVHGGPRYFAPTLIDHDVLMDLRALEPLAPNHLPSAIRLIEHCRSRFPDVSQVACFDTAFHQALPALAQRIPLPTEVTELGIRRYGFHGISLESIVRTLEATDPASLSGRVIIAHLGSGSSLTALVERSSFDTTMGCTPTGGVPMSTRSGDLDPGLVRLLMEQHGLDVAGFDALVSRRSGILGISGTSGDVAELLAVESTDERAREALDVYCYAIRKQIGALTAAMGGLDGLVFTGGIGENSPIIRGRVLDGLQFLGVIFDGAANTEGEPVLSTTDSQVIVRVVQSNEEEVIARATAARVLSAAASGRP